MKIATKLPCWLINERRRIRQDPQRAAAAASRPITSTSTSCTRLGANTLAKDQGPRRLHSGRHEKIKRGQASTAPRLHLPRRPLPLFKEILDCATPGLLPDTVQLHGYQFQAGTEGLKYAAKKGLAVVTHGAHRRRAPRSRATEQAIKELWAEGHHRWKPAEWALQWVWNHPEVSVVLSGMSSMEQVVENVKAAGRSGAGCASQKMTSCLSIGWARKYKEVGFIKCTSCRYCAPCPSGVAIPEIFSLVNEFFQKDRIAG